MTTPVVCPSRPTTGKTPEVIRAGDRWATIWSTVHHSGATTGSGVITSAAVTPARCSSRAAACSAVAPPRMNHPTSASHRPAALPAKASSRPTAIRTMPSIRPARAATIAARSRSPRRHHSTARRTRPPSSGAPGSRLNTASITLTQASQTSAVPGRPDVPTARASAALTRPMPRLVAGPASATSPSARAVGLGPPSWVNPPSIHRVIRSTLMPYARATRACASSWARRLRKKTSEVATAASQYAVGVSPGCAAGRVPVASRAANSTTVTRTDQWASTSTPRQ